NHRTGQGKRFQRRQVFGAEEAGIDQRESVPIKLRQVFPWHKTQEMNLVRQAQLRRRLPDMSLVAFVRAHEDDRDPDAMLVPQESDGLQQTDMVLVWPELRRIKEVACPNAVPG